MRLSRRLFNAAKPTLFEEIAARRVPADIVFEDERVIAFRDTSPAAPVHVLIVPKQLGRLDRLSSATLEDKELLGHLLLTVPRVAALLGVGDAFKVLINNGAGAGQSVFHLHLHLLAGAPTTPYKC